MAEISPNAIVAKTAKLAKDVAVGPFAYIGAKAQIGPGCVIANNATIVGRTTLGARTRVFPMAVIGAAAPGEEDDAGECVLGEANAVREHVTIYAGAEAPTQIGNHNLIMIASQVGAGAAIGDHGIFDNCSQIGAGAVIEDYVRMSGFAAVADGVRVGAYSFVAGYAGVMRDAPPYAMLQGFPVRVRGVNSRNLKACGFGRSDIHALKGAFRELFNGRGTNVSARKLRRLADAAGDNSHVQKLIEAVRAGAGEGEPVDE
jgi:UDP-N-acetylglucosamine acyltransferase